MGGEGGKSHRKGTTSNGRVILTSTGEEPKSIRANKRYYQLWKSLDGLNQEELQLLIKKRKSDIKYLTEDIEQLIILKTEILIIEDTYRIRVRKIKEEQE